jgi:hypothetical protein
LRKIKALLAAVAVFAGMLLAAPAASASTSYEWVHTWDYTGGGVTVQYAASNFVRVSYVHSTTCTEEKFEFWPSGTVAMYYRHSGTSSCDGVSWGTARWHTPNAGTSASLSWQSDENLVLRTGGGTVVWASGTNHCGTGCTTERQTLGTNGYWYLDFYQLCCFWQNERVYPG